jgi:hypothetical protein
MTNMPGSLQKPWNKNQGAPKLPPDWEEVHSKSTGKYYFYNRCDDPGQLCRSFLSCALVRARAPRLLLLPASTYAHRCS